jgi:acetylornithine deacetylase/succinyl-diaminopimelate desuccinylase-like protein
VAEDGVMAAIERGGERYVEELGELLRIPSVSALSERNEDTRRCAEWLAGHMRSIGLQQVQVMETPGHPVVYAEWRGAEPGAPTALVYGHYDVQPVEPLELWDSPPFEPSVRDGKLFARGAADDKGQLFMHLKAVEAHLEAHGALPINLKFLLEGEEEVGSPSLDPFIEAHRDLLACDVAVISDTNMFAHGLPSITYGLRGVAYLQVDVYGPASDLHSGHFGGTLMNPAEALARMLAALKDERGRVLVPGFYDRVRELTPEEREAWRALPFDEGEYARELGVPELWGEEGCTSLERRWARPTLEVNGVWGGWTGEGAKTVIPAEAHAKLSCRLVPDQDPDEISELLAARLRELRLPGTRVEVTKMHTGRPALIPLGRPELRAGGRALERGFGKEAVYIREGGSIPVVATFEALLGVPTVLMGVGLPDENAHAPNEWLLLDNFHGGVRSAAALYEELAR